MKNKIYKNLVKVNPPSQRNVWHAFSELTSTYKFRRFAVSGICQLELAS